MVAKYTHTHHMADLLYMTRIRILTLQVITLHVSSINTRKAKEIASLLL